VYVKVCNCPGCDDEAGLKAAMTKIVQNLREAHPERGHAIDIHFAEQITDTPLQCSGKTAGGGVPPLQIDIRSTKGKGKSVEATSFGTPMSMMGGYPHNSRMKGNDPMMMQMNWGVTFSTRKSA
jgi:hypothetical protein